MGLKPVEVDRLTFVEFAEMELGHAYREAKELDRLRRLQATIMTWGGMGAKEMFKPQDAMVIPLLDAKDVESPIKSRADVIKMIDLYIKGLEWQSLK